MKQYLAVEDIYDQSTKEWGWYRMILCAPDFQTAENIADMMEDEITHQVIICGELT